MFSTDFGAGDRVDVIWADESIMLGLITQKHISFSPDGSSMFYSVVIEREIPDVTEVGKALTKIWRNKYGLDDRFEEMAA